MKSKYTIGEVAEMMDLSVDTLRYYEKSSVIGEVTRDAGGRRSYSKKDIEWLGFVNCLKSTGMSLEHIREYLRLMNLGMETAPFRKELMVQHKFVLQKKMEELKIAMDRINHKIDFYDDLLKDHGLTEIDPEEK